MGGGNRLSSCIKAFTLAEDTTCVATLEDNRFSAFTLAEVLVTLGIIGIVSAMTVPSLMQNYQRLSYVTQLHKFYNILSQALVQYQNDRNALNLKEAGLTNLDALDEFFQNYFKIANNCNSKFTPCFASEYKNMLGKTYKVGLDHHITLADGTSVAYGAIFAYTNNIAFTVYVDINGPKGPNIAGRDVFAIYIYNNGLIDDYFTGMAPMSNEQRETAFNNYCADPEMKNWFGCFGKILNDNWQMTY